jgi:hypothetical protein
MENQEQTGAAQPELTVTDLTNIRAIIDIAVRRGTFGASEVSGVGTVFDKLNTFLNAVTPQKTEEQTSANQ